MKPLVFGVLITCLVTIVYFAVAHGEDAPQGMRGEHHSEYHDQYNVLYNNKKDVSCCHDRDCRPTQAKQIMEGDQPHWEVKLNGHWVRVDPDTIIPKGIDGIAHVCAGEPTTMNPEGKIYCVLLPPEY